MSNPLVESCLNIARAGYSGDGRIAQPYNDQTLTVLGNFLLNNSGLEKPVVLKTQRSKGSIALGFGAGIDSYCALHYAIGNGIPVDLVHVNYGQPYYEAERQVFLSMHSAWYSANGFQNGSTKGDGFLKDFRYLRQTYETEAAEIKFHSAKVELVPKDAEGLDWENYIIPARNLVLASICSQFADIIWIVANRRDDETVGTPDKTSRFYNLATKVFSSFHGKKVVVASPFFSLSKLQMVKNYIANGGSADALAETTSCYSPTANTQCGQCYACFKRFHLFQDLNHEVMFANHPQKGPRFADYEAAEKRKRG